MSPEQLKQIQKAIAQALQPIGEVVNQIRSNQKHVEGELEGIKKKMQPASGVGSARRAANKRVMDPDSLNVFFGGFNGEDFKMLLGAQHVRAPHILPVVGLVNFLGMNDDFGKPPQPRSYVKPIMECLTRAELPQKKNSTAAPKTFIDQEDWDQVDQNRFAMKACADEQILSCLWGAGRDGREKYISSKILELVLVQLDMRKETSAEAIMAQADDLCESWSGMASPIPGIGYGRCLIFGWNPRERLLLGEDSPMHRAWLAYCKVLDEIAERFDETFSDAASLYGYATFLTVAHYKVKVKESRGGMFESAGYGVMPEISKWESRIKGMANWLLDADACPTTNAFIVSERDRLNRLNEMADGAEDGAQMAVWASEQYVCELGACTVREPGEQPSDQSSELHARMLAVRHRHGRFLRAFRAL